MSSAAFFPSSQAEHDYIVQRATSLGLDPEAVLAVAAQEGGSLPSKVGDWSGQTGSYGPWQMRDPNLPGGGALPASVAARGPAFAEQWANSAEGIDYALSSIASAARGLRGPQAVSAIVYGFEHPANPAGETSSAESTYASGGGPGGQSDFAQWALANPSIARAIGVHGNEGVFSTTSDVAGTLVNTGLGLLTLIPGVNAGALGLGGGTESPQQQALGSVVPTDPFKFLTSWRFAEVVGGALLLLLALWLIARQFGLAPAVPYLPAGAQPSGTIKRSPPAPDRRPLREQPRRAQRRAGFELEVDRKPRRGEPGSSRLAPGDEVPF